MLETVSISDVSSYFKPLPPGWQAPPQPNTPKPEELLAEVERNKTAANVENDRAKQQTDRAKMITEDDRERDRAALDAWTKAWAVSAQHGTPMPSLDEFKAAMKSGAPAIGLLGDLPPPTSPQPPAVGQAQQQPPPGRPAPPMMPPQGPQPPMVPPRVTPPMAPPVGSVDPATSAAVRGALTGKGMPGSYGTLANMAMASPLMGAGGPRMPGPGGANAG